MPPSPLHGSSNSSFYFSTDPVAELDHLEDNDVNGGDVAQSSKDNTNRSLQQDQLPTRPHSPPNDILHSSNHSVDNNIIYTTFTETVETGSSHSGGGNGIRITKPDSTNNMDDSTSTSSATMQQQQQQQQSSESGYHHIGYGKQPAVPKPTQTSLLPPVTHHHHHHHLPMSTMPSPTTPPPTPTPTGTSSNRFGLSSIRRRQQNQKLHNQLDSSSKPLQKQPQKQSHRQEKQQQQQKSLPSPSTQIQGMNLQEEQPTSSSARRAQRHRKATKEYQCMVDRYYYQLTNGCGNSDCSNRFCASARGGILQLHSQAALSLSMVLASSSAPTAKLCLKSNQCDVNIGGNNTINTGLSQQQEEEATTDIDMSYSSTTIPFLQSLQTSPLFTRFFGNQSLPLQSTPSTTIPTQSNASDTCTYRQLEQEEKGEDVVDRLMHSVSSGGDYHEESLDLIRWLFRHWEAIGNAFLDTSSLEEEHCRVNIIKVLALYVALGKNESRSLSSQRGVSESFEVLLDRININIVSTMVDEFVMVEWARSIFCLTVWIAWHEDNNNNYTQIWPSILTQKFIKVISRLFDPTMQQCRIQYLVLETLSRLNSPIMKSMVDHLHNYLIDHFHVGPYRHGSNDTVVMAVKTLFVFYQANNFKPRAPIVPCDSFVNETLCNKLNIKDEYRIWKRVLAYGEGRPSASTLAALRHRQMTTATVTATTTTKPHRRQTSTTNLFNDQQRRSRLFLTPNFSSILLPYPFVNEYQFSWFSYAFLLTPAVKRKVLLMDCMSSMSMEYEDACVNHTLLVQAQRLLSSDAPQMVRSLEHHLKSAICPYLLLEIRRQHFVNDTIQQVTRKWSDLKKPLKVKFVDGGEEGVDQGGVQKEFFGVLFEHLLDKDMGLFLYDDATRLYWFRPCLTPDVRSYEMFGVLLGLSIYNGVILNVPFPGVFWKILCATSEQNVEDQLAELFTLDDLKQGWPQLAHGLEQLLIWSEENNNMTVEDVFAQNYELSFATFEEGLQTVPLIENGDSIPVTSSNRDQYVRDYCIYYMYQLQRDAILALRRGVWCVIGSEALESVIFPHELEMITCGWEQQDSSLSSSLDMKELEKVTGYDDGYHIDHPVIQHFWTIVHRDLTPVQKRKLLYFVTASDRVPVGGLKELTFVVQRNGPDSDRLPTALTCFSRLLLPEYASYEKLRDRLITSIENAKGFGLV
ncbi:hypothetical protein BC941DRAFT_410725 [Chlamydoabsidia padenii]|nr:hypothetical protein BC941DRAFT_410725 [Chlamydoabsidia padenii]